jgi:hypothetical protein
MGTLRRTYVKAYRDCEDFSKSSAGGLVMPLRWGDYQPSILPVLPAGTQANFRRMP